MKFAGVAISGKAGAGKNAFAAELALRLLERRLWPTEVNFADGLKRELLVEFGMTKEDPGGREKLIEIGHGRRQDDAAYWVKELSRRVSSLTRYGAFPVITDMRYINEYEWASSAGFLTVRVDATCLDRSGVLAARGEDPDFAWSAHASETDLDLERFHVRFANAHGPGRFALAHYAAVVASVVTGEEEIAA